MRTITLTAQQQRQIEILQRLSTGRLTTAEAAPLLGKSPRQTRRLRQQFLAQGLAAVVHGNQGRVPANRTDPLVVARIIALAGPDGPYQDWNTTHLQEVLADREGITIGRSTLDRLLKQHHLRRRRRKAGVVRQRRERRPAEGMLLQIDGSPHDWLEGRGPRLCLVGAIDDATGTIVFAQFRPTEDQAGYLTLLRQVAVDYGLPMAVYHDRHTILRSPKRLTVAEELDGAVAQSEVQRLLAELGIESIAALSPQAKGRIERLWGTLQDRLCKELRLAGAATLAEANAFLPAFVARYNARFAQPATDPEPAWVRLEPDIDVAYYFARRETRTVRADHTLAWLGQTLQLAVGRHEPSLARTTVTVHVTPEDELYVYQGRRRLAYQVVAAPPQLRAPAPAPTRSTPPKPVDPAVARRRRGWAYAGLYEPVATRGTQRDDDPRGHFR
jgi:hypothetical protein